MCCSGLDQEGKRVDRPNVVGRAFDEAITKTSMEELERRIAALEARPTDGQINDAVEAALQTRVEREIEEFGLFLRGLAEHLKGLPGRLAGAPEARGKNQAD